MPNVDSYSGDSKSGQWKQGSDGAMLLFYTGWPKEGLNNMSLENRLEGRERSV